MSRGTEAAAGGPIALVQEGDIISIDDPELSGIYEETGWSLTMAAGQMMQHTAKRTVIA